MGFICMACNQALAAGSFCGLAHRSVLSPKLLRILDGHQALQKERLSPSLLWEVASPF